VKGISASDPALNPVNLRKSRRENFVMPLPKFGKDNRKKKARQLAYLFSLKDDIAQVGAALHSGSKPCSIQKSRPCNQVMQTKTIRVRGGIRN
jgi:hypothetical protein